MRNRHIIYLLFFVVIVSVLAMRDFTPSNELRYLSIADEALRHHSLFAFTNHGLPYADKPPLYVWILMLCRCLAGSHHMWLVGMFSLLPAIGIVSIMDKWTCGELSGEQRLMAQTMTLTSGLFLVVAMTLRMDMLMTLFIVLALREFWFIHTGTGHSRSGKWLFPLYVFMAVFTKGPLGLLIPMLSTGVFLATEAHDRASLKVQMHSFLSLWGGLTLIVLLACFVLWFGAVYAEGGTEYLDNLLFHQTIGRAFHSFHHRAPVYYYAVVIWYCLAPWSLLVAGLFVSAFRRGARRNRLQRFLLSVGVTSFVVLSFLSGKLQIYLLPAVPFMVYSAIMSLPSCVGKSWTVIALAIPSVIFIVALPVLLLVSEMPGLSYLGNAMMVVGASVLATTGLFSLFILIRRRGKSIYFATQSIGFGMLLALFCASWSLPKLNPYLGYSQLCHRALEVSRVHSIKSICTWKISRAENMDVFFHHSVVIIPDSVKPNLHPAKPYLLLTDSKALRQLPKSNAIFVEPYSIVIVGRAGK